VFSLLIAVWMQIIVIVINPFEDDWCQKSYFLSKILGLAKDKEHLPFLMS
jgi:hypothetical protein